MKIALIGAYGHQNYTIQGVREIQNSRISAVAKSHPNEDVSKLVTAIKHNHGYIPEVYDDWQVMLDKVLPDIASVSPMFCENQKISVECLKRNINVFCEKPVATHLHELSELIETYNKSSATFTSMHAMRYQPEFRGAYDALKSGTIGQPLLISSQKSYAFSTQRPQFYKERSKFGSTLCWVGIHALDWTYWMMGKIGSIYASHTTLGNMGYRACESSGIIAFNFLSGGQGCINFDFLKAHKDKIPQDRCRIAGEKGVIEICNRKTYIVTHDEEIHEIPLQKEESIFKAFVDACSGKKECLINAEDTFEVTRLALLARKSADENILINTAEYQLPQVTRKNQAK